MNTGVHGSFLIIVLVFQDIYLEVKFLDPMVVLLQFYEEPPYCFPQWLHQFTFPPTMYEGSLFSTSSPVFVICTLFDDNLSDKCQVVSHCSFDLHLSDDSNVLHLFICLLPICISSLEKCLFTSAQFLMSFFFMLSCMLFIYVEYLPLINHIICKYFLSFIGFSFFFCFVNGFL